MAQRPGVGGLTWVFLQYLLGFRRLGYEVLFLDRLDPGMCVDVEGRSCHFTNSYNLQYFLDTMHGFGFSESFSLDYDSGQQIAGLQRAEVLKRVRNAELLVNVMGYLRDEEILAAARRRVFLDIDPGFGQMWQALGLCEMFNGHDDYVTIGLNIGRSECEIPTCGINWITTCQPVVRERWPEQRRVPPCRLTSVVSWRGLYAPVEYNGTRYGLRVHEFRKFLELPRATGKSFELAVDLDPADSADRSRLLANGWSLVDPKRTVASPSAYQHYVQNSWAEFQIAKGMYVQTRSGWISDRSICYLASGRPVIAQDTGLKHLYPTGAGLVLFSTPDEARAAVEEVSRDYAHHAQAARDVAVEFFDSDKVLRRLLAILGVE